jgi:hypothetical protein
MCLVNNAVYIAKGKDIEWCEKTYGYVPSKQKKYAGKWTATGKQFQVPYVFKTLFSKEPIEFADVCETKEVKTAIYLDMNESLPAGEHDYHFVGKVGNFCPILPGHGGGELVRETIDKSGNVKYDAVTGSLKPDKTPYRWLETEAVQALQKEDCIDKSYYRKLVDDAVESISYYGDFERFIAEEPYAPEKFPGIDFPPDEDPPWYSDDELEAIREAEKAGLPYYITAELARAMGETDSDDTFRKR